jgi:hypothetical protein
LQDSLGGNTRTLFVVTLSASEANAEETLSTLQFADRAMRVQVYAAAQQIEPPTAGNTANNETVRRLQAEVDRLRACLQAIRAAPRLLECMDGMSQTSGAEAASKLKFFSRLIGGNRGRDLPASGGRAERVESRK